MSKWFAILLILTMLLYPSRGASQQALQLSTLEVDLWPEYDRPGVLVIYHLTLPTDATLPASLSLRIPKEVGEPHAVAVQQPNGQLFSIAYDVQISGDYLIISFMATLPQVQVEYYDPQLTVNAADGTRQFTYTWQGDYTAERMVVQVQEPPEANNLSITPGPVSSRVESDGLTYYQKDIGPINAGQTFSLKISYQKDSESLTIEKLQVQPSAPLSTAPTWQDRLSTALPWILGILGVLLIVGGGFWFLKSSRQTKPVKRSRRTRAPILQTSQAGSESAIYCHQCGKRASAGDRFCRSCGTRLRIE